MDMLRIAVGDGMALVAVESAVAGLLVVSLLGSLRTQARIRRGAVRGVAERSERTMGMLWAAYGVVTVTCALAVQVSEGLQGFRVSLIAADYAVLTYLFFFNSWFRNRIALPWLRRATRD
jgi:hypothetical protein